ncbi:MAG: S8 family serine peptidase, partial [Phototrophicaceae bacterium]
DMSRDFAIQVIDRNGTAVGTDFALFVEFVTLPNGNASGSILSPGDSPNSLTVGALDGTSIADYSSRGPLSNGGLKPDLVAPGFLELNGSYFVGTSASSSLVTGAASLVWEAYPDYSAQDVFTFLLNSAQDDGEIAGRDNIYGNGSLYLPIPDVSD